MPKQWIKNSTELATTEARQKVLHIINAGFDAIDTRKVISSHISLTGNTLTIKKQEFDLTGIDNIYVIGFGKASCLAAAELENILGDKIAHGLAIGLTPIACEYVQTYGGTHPHPSAQNVELSQKILELSERVTERDLVIVIVSGGGSALLCWPLTEFEQASRLYKEFLKTGGTIQELNTVRKHISLLKGGGLAKYLYPARVVGLIFSDIPGNNFAYTASGPTYKDTSTVADAQAILDKYGLQGYELNETPTEDKYFERVTNIPLVSNLEVLAAMQAKAAELTIPTEVISAELYDTTQDIAKLFIQRVKPNTLVLGAGEPKTTITVDGGSGGRCQRVGMEILPQLTETDVFAAVASDGLDNSPYAGIIEDHATLTRMQTLGVDYDTYYQSWDNLTFYQQLGNELLETGPTQANVSDFMLLYRSEK